MKTVTNNKKRFMALTIAFTMVLTIAMQVIVRAEDCKETSAPAQSGFEADPKVEVTCQDCNVESTSEIKNSNGTVIGYRYTFQAVSRTMHTQTCHSAAANKSCSIITVTGGYPYCPSVIEAYIDDTGTGASTGTGGH
ncbi:hypothetical protein [Mucilaginibacter sp. UYCu711]|uniref:hypothetical protein n=1 Tax=Mucilaginibacter sp. UYCu711 TaxID=3156339 RepID=UPI003D211366